MGDVLAFEQPSPHDEPDAMDTAPPGAGGEIVDLETFLLRKVTLLLAQQREYSERAERVAHAFNMLKARLRAKEETTDAERIALLDEFTGAEAMLRELIETIQTIRAEIQTGLERSQRMKDQRRNAGGDVAA